MRNKNFNCTTRQMPMYKYVNGFEKKKKKKWCKKWFYMNGRCFNKMQAECFGSVEEFDNRKCVLTMFAFGKL